MECEMRLKEIVDGFQKCRNAFTAIGDEIAMRREGTKNYYYLSVDETGWKEIADLVNLIYESIRCNSSCSEI